MTDALSAAKGRATSASIAHAAGKKTVKTTRSNQIQIIATFLELGIPSEMAELMYKSCYELALAADAKYTQELNAANELVRQLERASEDSLEG